MSDRSSAPELPLRRRTFLRTAAASSLPLFGATGATGVAAAQDEPCSVDHPCDPRIRCYDPVSDDVSTVLGTSSWEGGLESINGATLDAGTGLDVVAVYRGTVDYGQNDCRPVWDLLVGWQQFYERNGEQYNFEQSVDVALEGSDSLYVPPLDDNHARVWLEGDPSEFSDVEEDPTDEQEELREYYDREGVIDVTKYDDTGLLITGLAAAVKFGISASGYGLYARAGVTVLSAGLKALSGQAVGDGERSFQIANHHTDEQNDDVGFLYLGKFTAEPQGDAEPGDAHWFSVDAELNTFGDDPVGPDLEEDPEEHAHSLEIPWRLDRPARFTGTMDLSSVGGTTEIEIRNADGEVLTSVYQELTDDPNDTSLAVEELDYDFFAAEEEFPLRLVQVDDILGDDVIRELHWDSFRGGLEAARHYEYDISTENERVVVDSGDASEAQVPVSDGSQNVDRDVYLPVGTDEYATADVGFSSPQRSTRRPPAGTLLVSGEELAYFDGSRTEQTVTGSDVGDAVDWPHPGHVWVDGDELRYVDQDETIRALSGEATKSLPDAQVGSLWIEGGTLAFVSEGGQKILVSPSASGDAELTITDLDASPSKPTAGETVDVTAEYTNEGGDGTVPVELEIGGRTAGTGSISAADGESGTATLTAQTTSEDVDDISNTIELITPSETVSTSLDVQENPANSGVNLSFDYFRVDPNEATPGDTVEYSGSLTNVGESGPVVSRLYLGDRLIDENEYSLDSGEVEEGTQTIEVTMEDLGAEELRIEYVHEGTTVSAPLTVTDVCAETDSDGVLASGLSVPDDMQVGEPATIEGSYTYCGDGEGLAVTDLTFAGRDVGGLFEQIEHREEETTSVEVVPETGESGEVTVRAVGDGDGIERTVSVAPAELTVEIAGEATVTDGTFELPVTLTNEHSVEVEKVVEVRNQGDLLAERDVAVAASSSSEIVLEGDYPGGERELTVVVGTETAAITVEPEDPEPDCVEVGELEPCDVNGDGLYRDVSGDGSVTQTDVVEFFRHQHRSAWKQPDKFDYTGNGSVGQGDVIALFEYVAMS